MRTTPIKLTFICDQDWSTMPPTEKGRHCKLCDHEVIDFSTKTNAEILSIISGKEKLCGNFSIGQLEPHLVPLEFGMIKRSKYWLAAISTFFGLQVASLKAQEKKEIRMEQGPSYRVIENRSGKVCVKDKEQSGDEKTRSIREKETISDKDPLLRNLKPKTGTTVTTYYVSLRFPFVHKRRSQAMGNMTGRFL